MTQSTADDIIVAEATPIVSVPERYQNVTPFYLSSSLFAASLVCFLGGLFADLTYVNSPDIEWSNFSAWLLAFGELFIALVILFGILGFLMSMKRKRTAANWLYGLFILAAAVVGLFNNLIHSHDGWTSVWPTGLMLSAATVGLLIVAMLFKLATLSKIYVMDAR
jgi:uncharacterized membrane protein